MNDNTTGPTSRTYFSQRLRLHYVDWGNPTKPTLLMVHGVRDHCRNWDWVAEKLRDDWRIIAVDLRGHGDSDWAGDGNYTIASYIYDLAQLIDQQALAPVTILSHSLGGRITIRYAGIYPEKVNKLVAIEGLGPAPRVMAKRAGKPMHEKMRQWIDEERDLAGRLPRRYATLDDAIARMQEENKRLSPEQVRHLTSYSVNQNEDGTYSWKFDNYTRVQPPYEMAQSEIEEVWSNVKCPALFISGTESWHPNAEEDGKTKYFPNSRAVSVQGAGHWVHHDKLDELVGLFNDFTKTA